MKTVFSIWGDEQVPLMMHPARLQCGSETQIRGC
jgi:hypothetical protein